jgi:two-component sensor histidine kinase
LLQGGLRRRGCTRRRLRAPCAWTFYLQASSDAGRDARDYVASVSHLFSSHVANDLALVVTELVTNSVRHANLGVQDVIELKLLSSSRRLQGEVADGGKGLDLSDREGYLAGCEGGFGLRIVDELTDRWGFSNGRVWFEIDDRSVLSV